MKIGAIIAAGLALAAATAAPAVALETAAKALKLARRPRASYSHALAAKAVMEGDYEGALKAISRAPQQGDTLGQAMLLLIAELADAPMRAEGAAAALARLQKGDPELVANAISRACWRPEVKKAFADALARTPAKAAP